MIETKSVSNEMSAIAPRKASQISALWRRFKKNKSALVGGTIFFIFFVLAVIGPYISPNDPRHLNYNWEYNPPCNEFRLGTDSQGRDVLSFILYGARTSFIAASGALIIELIFSLIIGGFAGYFGGWIDEILMRITDIFMTIPTIVLLIVAVSMFKVRSELLITLIMGFISWPWMSRVIRSQFLFVRETDFVKAVRSLGASHIRIIFRHILPNALSPIIVFGTIDMAWFIMYEASLNFLGLGDPSAVSWGVLINSGANVMRSGWWVSTFPGLAIFITTLGLNLLGDGLRDALDVRI